MPSSARTFVLMILVLPLLGVVSLFGSTSVAADYPLAPSFSCTTLSGTKLTSDTLAEGRPYVVLIFFGVNCKPCQTKIAQLNAVWRNERFREKARIYAVNADGFDAARLSAEVAKRQISIDFPVVVDDNQVITNLYVDRIVPLTVVIGNRDRILLTSIGARVNSVRKIEEMILAGKDACDK